MQVLICPMGSAGDVFPFLGLATALRNLGHHPTLFTSDHFAQHAKRQEIDFLQLGATGAYQSAIQSAELWHPRRAFGYLYRNMVQPVLQQQFDEVIARDAGPHSLTVINCFGFGALCAAEASGARVAMIHLQPAVVLSYTEPPVLPGVSGPKWLRRWLLRCGEKFLIDPIVCPSLNRFRAGVGLAPVRNILHWWYSKTLNVMMFPEWYAPRQPDWPAPCIQVPFPLWEDRAGEELPEAVDLFLKSGSPPIAISGGSANLHAANLFKKAVEACESAGQRALLLTAHPEQLPKNLPASALHCPFVPLQKLLPRCLAMVNHGGIGTVSQAIAAGIPQIVIPLAHDQFDNALRVESLNLGHAFQAKRWTANSLRKAIESVVADKKIQESIRLHANLAQPGVGLEQAAQALVESA